MGAKGSVEAAKINAQNWNDLEVRYFFITILIRAMGLKGGVAKSFTFVQTSLVRLDVSIDLMGV